MTGVFDNEATSAKGPVTADSHEPMTTSRPCSTHSTARLTAATGCAKESWMSTSSLKPAGRSKTASGTSEESRVLMWCTAMAAAATMDRCCGRGCASECSGTSTPTLASTRTQCPPSFA
eukprot:3542239-Rhodomonas_salina.1